ncbi:GNAT family N-acetyltransferase [Micromonospora sp. DT4]|uniref:GNAT family N-acetyltransferase n=1 Tax=Micromonospora sp. DT4 TaxID=3393438 RepID=UPI003CEF1311
MIGQDIYVENASAMWRAVAPDDTQKEQAYFRADLPRMTRILVREPLSAEGVSGLVDDVSSTKSVVVEDVYGGHEVLPASTVRVLRMPVMVRSIAAVPAAVTKGVRIVQVSDPAELAVAERVIVEGFPVSALLPWRRGEALPPHVLGVPGWRVWLAYRDGAAAGAGYTFDDGNSVGLYWLVTSPEHRSVGLARALLTQAIRANPARPFTLVATDAGMPLYESLDFRTAATATWYMRSPA